MLAGIGAIAPVDDTVEGEGPAEIVQPSGADIVELQSWEPGDAHMSLGELAADLFRTGRWRDGSDWLARSDGSGVDVALVDTGVAPVHGLSGSSKVLHGPDLSYEGQYQEVAYLDTYGHGTHMAGIIAGEREGDEGVAPGARIVSVKTAGADGVTTVPQVVAAIDWVVEHRDAEGLRIRVLNLSLGRAGVCDHQGDFLSAAVERAWHAGIVVVVAAGNDGDVHRCLNSPAVDPYVIAVGAVDQLSDRERDERDVPEWSATGDGDRDPDVVAPGRSIASYRVPGSTIDRLAPNARVDDDSFLGTGTSQSAAIVSGLAARILSARPDLRPDDVKKSIEEGADRLDDVRRIKQGDGHVDGRRLDRVEIDHVGQRFPAADGGATGIVAPQGATWSGGGWSGATWSGATWSGATWSGATWSGATWSGATWSGATWSGATWSGATWSGATWSGDGWS